MSDSVPTVKIKSDNESGYVVINESDYDEKVHKLLTEKQEAKADAEAAEQTVDLSKLKKQELIEVAVSRGVEIDASMTVKQIVEAIEAAE